MAFIWLRMTGNPAFLLYVKYLLDNCCVPVDRGIIDKFLVGKSFLLSSQFLDNLQGDPSPVSYSVCTQGKQLGQEAYHISLSSARVKNMWNSTCCTSTPLSTLTVWCLMKHGDSFTLYGVCSC